MYYAVIFAVLSTAALYVLADDKIYYDTLTGQNLTNQEYQQLEKANLTFWCSYSYKPCDENEYRRQDGTCNNLKYPYRGGPRTPSARDLPPQFGKDYGPPKTKRGEERPLARKVRTESLIDGVIPDQKFTAMVPAYVLFVTSAFASIHDSVNYIRWTKTCCLPEGKDNPICSPMMIPDDDTVHQFSNIRCMNMTKPLTYQNLGCPNRQATPERINSATNFWDLNLMYQYDDSYRSKKDGLLEVDVDNGVIWPVSTKYPEFVCLQNRFPEEKRCHKIPPMNGLIGSNFFSIMFWRLHNFIAKELKKSNPSWDDEKLFQTARDITIALSLQIFYYELMGDFMGKKNLVRDGVLSSNGGFRDLYDEDIVPQSTTEFVYGWRWAHTIQPGMTEFYDKDGKFKKQVRSVDLSLRTGFLGLGKNLEELTHGIYRQPMGNRDHVVDPIISQVGFGQVQRAFDITTADLHKAGLLGIPSYIKYRELCSGKKYRSFDDLARDMDPENIEIIKKTQKDVEDVPLLLGIWLEKMIPGGHMPQTLYCITAKQMKRLLQYDRHWYERPNRPHAFNKQQLAEIRKATIAWVLCTIGDSVTQIQPKAFLRHGSGNKMTSCKNIRKPDFKAWKEE